MRHSREEKKKKFQLVMRKKKRYNQVWKIPEDMPEDPGAELSGKV
jgi:hypothetical protein